METMADISEGADGLDRLHLFLALARPWVWPIQSDKYIAGGWGWVMRYR